MDKAIFHSLIGDLFALINAGKDAEASKRFGISEEVIEEIKDTIIDYFGSWQEVKPIDIKAHPQSRANKPVFDVFQMNQPNSYGVECVLVDSVEGETELVFHAEFVKTDKGYKMNYKYIGS